MRFQDFNQSVKNFAPTGASMGISLQSMGAGLAYLTDRGNNAEVASTRLTMGLSMATAGSKAANTYMKDLGLTTGTLDLKNKSLQATMMAGGLTTNKFAADLKKPDGLYVALSDMQHAFTKAGLSKNQADQVMAKIFGGGRSDKAIVSLMQNLDGVRQKYDAIGQGVKNYGKDVATEQATAQQKWKDFIATSQNLATGFGNTLLPTFTKLVGGMAGLLQGKGGGILGGTLAGAMALFAGNKLFSGAASAVGTVGKIADFLKIPGLSKLAGAGQVGGAAAASGSLDAVASSGSAAAEALGRVAGTGALGGGAGGSAGAAEAGLMSKIGRGLGTAAMTAGGAWALGHLIGAFLPNATKADQQQYKGQVPGWLQGIGGFIFGNKAASLYGGLPKMGGPVSGQNWANWFHDIFGGGGGPKPAKPLASFPNGQPFYGEVPHGLPKPIPAFPDGKPFYGEVPHGLPKPIPVYPNGQPFYGEVPHGLPKPIPTLPSGQPFYASIPQREGIKPAVLSQGPTPQGIAAHPGVQLKIPPVKIPAPDTSAVTAAMAKLKLLNQPMNLKPIKIPAPDTSAVGAVKARLTAALTGVTIKPVKVPAPDMSGVDAAKGKAASAGSGITQAIQGAMHPAKMPAPNLSAASAAVGQATGIGAQISAGLAAGIRSGIGAIAAAAAAAASAASAAMAGAAKTHSPSKVTEKIGADIAEGATVGIKAGTARMAAAAAAAATRAAAAMAAAAKGPVKVGKDLASTLVTGLQGGQSAIDAANAALGKNTAKAADVKSIESTVTKLKADVKGDTGLVKWLTGQQSKLTGLAGKRAALETEISDSEQAAQNVLTGSGSIMNALTATPASAAEPVSSQAITQGQQYQAQGMAQFATQLQQLQKLGLNATSLSQIAQAGPEQGLSLAQGITSGGKQAVVQLNQLQKQMHASAAKIGDVAGVASYQSGKDIAAGLADDLKADLTGVDKAMEKAAKAMVASVEKHDEGGEGQDG